MNEQAPNVIDTITEDHREFESLFALAREQQDPAEFKRIADLTIAELVRHAVAEEMYLYPAFREYYQTAMSWPVTRSKSMPRPSAR